MRDAKNNHLNIIKKIGQNWSLLLVGAILLVMVIYVVIKGEYIHVQPFDFMDSNIPWYKMLTDNHMWFGNEGVVPMLSGISRLEFFLTEFNVYYALYMIFPAFYAMVAGYLLKIILSVLSAMYLGRTLLIKGEDRSNYDRYKNIIVLCGLLFGIAPMYPSSDISFATLPFLLAILYRLYHQGKKRYFIVLLFYPLFSELGTFGVFICGYLGLFWLIDAIVHRKVRWRMLGGLASLSLGYILVEYRLFYLAFFSNEASIRTEYVRSYISTNELIRTLYDNMVNGPTFANALHKYVALPVCSLFLVYLFVRAIQKKNLKAFFTDPYVWIYIWIGVNAVFATVEFWDVYKSFISKISTFMHEFDISRCIWLNTFLWYTELAYALIRICELLRDHRSNPVVEKNVKSNQEGSHEDCKEKHQEPDNREKNRNKRLFRDLLGRISRPVAYLLCLANLVFILETQTFYNVAASNWEAIKRDLWGKGNPWLTTFGEYFSPDLMEQAKEACGYDGSYAVAFGLDPAVLEYSGIATLDGKLNYYSLAYKKEFCELIAPELEQNETHRSYMKRKGVHAYVLPVDLDESNETAMLQMDMDKFREMGGKYVFSALEILNAEEQGLTLVGECEDERSPYHIRCYQAAMK